METALRVDGAHLEAGLGAGATRQRGIRRPGVAKREMVEDNASLGHSSGTTATRSGATRERTTKEGHRGDAGGTGRDRLATAGARQGRVASRRRGVCPSMQKEVQAKPDLKT